MHVNLGPMRQTFTRQCSEAAAEYLPFYHGFNVDSFEVTIRLSQGGSITIGAHDESSYLSVPHEGISTGLAGAAFWLEKVRHAFITRDVSPRAWPLDETKPLGVLTTQDGKWSISQGGNKLQLDLVEMEQVLNAFQLIVALGMAESRPSEVNSEEFAQWSHHRVDMLQACQTLACCAHGHHLAEPVEDPLGAHEL